ncbi:helix-turn-helix transcriptional regulator [Spirillospora sp. NPDC048911]|uniref:helix-turn-helix transcriptional regulator n=1 Tax=Spirillospora sp. NPDC048911 TaxID=3364527 RepID=UPI0037179703
MTASGPRDGKMWTFLTNHARVLICIARSPDLRMRDIADFVGITERAAQLIVTDLEEAGYLSRTKVGRRNTYTVNPDLPFRHPAEADHDVHDLLALFASAATSRDEHPRSADRRPHPAANGSTT